MSGYFVHIAPSYDILCQMLSVIEFFSCLHENLISNTCYSMKRLICLFCLLAVFGAHAQEPKPDPESLPVVMANTEFIIKIIPTEQDTYSCEVVYRNPIIPSDSIKDDQFLLQPTADDEIRGMLSVVKSEDDCTSYLKLKTSADNLMTVNLFVVFEDEQVEAYQFDVLPKIVRGDMWSSPIALIVFDTVTITELEKVPFSF